MYICDLQCVNIELPKMYICVEVIDKKKIFRLSKTTSKAKYIFK